jgi:lysozyme family protein
MSNFEEALRFVLRAEGGVVNDEDDRGGLTAYGVTQATYNDYRLKRGLPVRRVAWIRMEEVRDLYRLMYWMPAGCEELPLRLATVHFDWAVNHGVAGAIRTLQGLLGVPADGKLGPKTRNALRATTAVPGMLDLLVSRYIIMREATYRQLARKASQGKFLEGWLNRLARLRVYISNLARR